MKNAKRFFCLFLCVLMLCSTILAAKAVESSTGSYPCLDCEGTVHVSNFSEFAGTHYDSCKHGKGSFDVYEMYDKYERHCCDGPCEYDETIYTGIKYVFIQCGYP